MELSMGQRQAVMKKLALAYKPATRGEKSRILSELVKLIGGTLTTLQRPCDRPARSR
jgi:hypothetical protein